LRNIVENSGVKLISIFFLQISLASFATYVWSQPTEPLTVEKAFVSITLFNIIRFPLTSMPTTITQMTELWVSAGRIIGFLQAEDYAPRQGVAAAGGIAATIRSGSFGWTHQKPVLQDIDMMVRESQLVAVCGKVATGKSSLVAALLGDINCTSGEVRLSGSVAYVPQEPWIQHATIRDNILFGQQMDENFYRTVIDACELREDLDALPNGDATEIGERGINLSGGQKQRIALARAIYRQADIYLLDDPLSAVDYQVGRRIFDQAIGPNGLLRGKARILVTHDIHAVEAATEVYELKACGQLRKLDVREPLITLDGLGSKQINDKTNSITEKTEPKTGTAKQQFQKIENLVGKEHLSHGIKVFNNLMFYIVSMRVYRFILVGVLAMGYHGLAVWANVWLSTWASDEMDKQHWYLVIYFVFGVGQGK
jgi:ABC-type transport system involved in cytochrome bd biosynthesis fused ATPase/permease subunit